MALQEAQREHENPAGPTRDLSVPHLQPNNTQNSLAPLLMTKTDVPNDGMSEVVIMPTDSHPHEDLQEPQGKCGSCASFRKLLRSKLLVILSIVGVILGFGIGFAVRPFKPSEDLLMWLGFPGDIFLSLLKMTILPLIISSVITATSSMDPQQNGRIGALQLTYLSLTNLLGAVMGITLGAVIKPGAQISEDINNSTSGTALRTTDVFSDLIRNIFPDNIARAMMQKKMTSYERVAVETSDLNITTDDLYEMRREVIHVNSTNIIGLIFVCVIFGIAAGQAKEKGRPFLDFFRSVSDIVLIVIDWFLCMVVKPGLYGLVFQDEMNNVVVRNVNTKD